MKHTQTAWATQRPDKVIVIRLIRANRLDAINALRDHLTADQQADAWRIAFRRGFRAVKVTVTAVNPASSSAEC